MDIPSGTVFEHGDTAPVVREKLNGNVAWTQAELQGIEDRLEGTVGEVVGTGVLRGLGVTAGTGLSVRVGAGAAVVGHLVVKQAATTGVAVEANATNYVFLMQDGSFAVNTSGEPPQGQLAVLLAAVVTGESGVVAVDNDPAGKQRIGLLPGLGAGEGIALCVLGEGLVQFDSTSGHAHDGVGSRPVAGTRLNSFTIGDGAPGDKSVLADTGAPAKPGIRYNNSTYKWQYSNNGSAWNDIGPGGGTGTPCDAVASETAYGQAANPGTASEYSRGDHTHGTPALATAAPADVGTVPAAGTGSTPARSDHVHKLGAGSVSETVAIADGVVTPQKIANGSAGQLLEAGSAAPAWAWPSKLRDADGDTTVQLERSEDEDVMRFETAGEERVTVDSAGNVVVGSAATPGAISLSVHGSAYPVLRVARHTGATGGSVQTAMQVRRTTSAPTANGGVCQRFSYPDSAGNDTPAGAVGARLTTVTDGSEVGELLLAPAWQGEDPAGRTDVVVRAVSATDGALVVKYRALFGGSGTAFYPVDVVGHLRIQGNNRVLFGGSGNGDWDVNLYRSAANVLKTDDTVFAVGGYQSSDGTAGATASVEVARPGGGTRALQFKNGLYVGYTDS